MSWLNVEKALVKSFLATTVGISYPSIQENDAQERQEVEGNSDYWVEYFNLPAATIPLDKNLHDEYSGIFQLSIYTRLNGGKAGILGIVDELIPFYQTGQEYLENDYKVMIYESSVSPARADGSYFVVDLTIEWGAYICRQALI